MTRRFLLAAALGAVGAAVSGARADYIGPLFNLTATNDSGTASYVVEFDRGSYDPGSETWTWKLLHDVELLDPRTDELIGVLNSASVTYIADPQISLNFAVTAGQTDTAFTISSAQLAFGALTNPPATTSTGITATDNTGDGVAVTGRWGGGGAYLAQYNGAIPGGIDFAEFLPSVATADPFGTANGSDSTGGLVAIFDTVMNMSAGFNFELTAEDQASGSSTFVIIPAPATGVALLAGLVIRRRRRRH